MRDEVKKPVVAPASRSRRAAVWGLVIVILAGLGYEPAQLAALRARGAIR